MCYDLYHFFNEFMGEKKTTIMLKRAYLNNNPALVFIGLASGMPALWRFFATEYLGFLGVISDLTLGMAVFFVAMILPRWPRLMVVTFWGLFHCGAFETLAAMQRFPVSHDVVFLVDPVFINNSFSELAFSYPLIILLFVGSTIGVALTTMGKVERVGLTLSVAGVAVFVTLFLHHKLSERFDYQSLVSRYNPLHWFLLDLMPNQLFPQIEGVDVSSLPIGLQALDLSGTPLVEKGRAKNVLIIALEGIPGMYYPEIGAAMQLTSDEVAMPGLQRVTTDAMLIPDFVVHSHQTIRGLYAMLCGDFSKLSWHMPKAYELQENPQRAKSCLPAQLAEAGWATHYLQAAGLEFMSKDWVMPLIGFQEVHGREWFSEPNPFPFNWGAIDEVFFRGAKKYIDGLRQQDQPWMLTLLTVGTHQPYAVPDEIADNFLSRKFATVALLDQAVETFIASLRKEGILDDTLVLITSDESHGSPLADWVSSWGLAVILAPERETLPRIKSGGYGLLDVTVSVLDYLGLDMPPMVIGRSMFREYVQPREMVSYTAQKLRYHSKDNLRYECSDDGLCRMGAADSLLGQQPEKFLRVHTAAGNRMLSMASLLDEAVRTATAESRTLHFANGLVRRLPEHVVSEWGDNLVGAQYLDFPANSTVRVVIRVKALEAAEGGIHLKLHLKSWESPLGEIPIPEFSVLRGGEEEVVEFDFFNQESRRSFSFHLVGEGKDAVIQLDEFSVTIEQANS
jgi:hypothetical protein